MSDASNSHSSMFGGAQPPLIPDRPTADLLRSPHTDGPFTAFLSADDIGPVQMFEAAILPSVYPQVRMVATVADSRWNDRALTVRLKNAETPADFQRWFYHAAHYYGSPWICRKTMLPIEFIAHEDGVGRTKLLHHLFACGAADERIHVGERDPVFMDEARRRGFIYLQAPLMAHLHWWMDPEQWKDVVKLDSSLNALGMRTTRHKDSSILPKIHDTRSFLIKLGDWPQHGHTPAVPPNVRSRIP